MRIRWDARPVALWWEILGLAAFGLIDALCADHSGGFWWFDSASHALNGVFLLDALKDGGLTAPLRFALTYFAHYPGLTIGFYPPGFALWLLPFYALLGVSQTAAQIAVTSATLLLALGMARLARLGGFDRPAAFAAGLIAVAFPDMIFWGQQIQPEIPSYALAIWSLVFLISWLRSARRQHLTCSALLMVASLYVKQTTLFLLLPMAIVAVGSLGVSALRRAAGPLLLAILLLLPLIAMTLAFGQMNVSQLSSSPEPHDALFYVRALPGQTGIVLLLLAGLGLVLALTRRVRLPPDIRLLCLSWFGCGLIFFSLIALKNPRFSTAIVPPLAILAVLPFRLLPAGWLRGVAPPIFAAAVAATGFLGVHPARYEGMAEIAHQSAAIAPPDSTILLFAHRSANFIFNLRAHEQRGDLDVIRAEKLYLDYRVGRQFGITDSGADQARILSDLRARNVAIVTIERDLWRDLPSITALHRLLDGPSFEKIASLPVTDSEDPRQSGTFDLYRLRDYVPQPQQDLEIKLPLIGRTFTFPRHALP